MGNPSKSLCILVGCVALSFLLPANSIAAQPDTLPGTEPLTAEGDLAAQMRAGIDRFVTRATEESVAGRKRHWNRDFSSPAAYEKSIEPNRKRLAHILGVRDQRIPFKSPELVATLDEPALVGKGANYEILAVRWPVIGKMGCATWSVINRQSDDSDVDRWPSPHAVSRTPPTAGRRSGRPLATGGSLPLPPRSRTSPSP